MASSALIGSAAFAGASRDPAPAGRVIDVSTGMETAKGTINDEHGGPLWTQREFGDAHYKRADEEQDERSRGCQGEVGAGIGDHAVEPKRKDVDLGADQRQRGSIGPDRHSTHQAKGGEQCRRQLRQQDIGQRSDPTGAERLRGLQLALVEIRQHRQQQQDRPAGSIIDIGEHQAEWAVEQA